VANDFSGNKRTLRAYVADLLEFPRWLISTEVDFRHCRLRGHHNEFLAECAQCRFGEGCRWLDRNGSPASDAASLSELVQALDSAVVYLQATAQTDKSRDSDTNAWLRQARQFLRSDHE